MKELIAVACSSVGRGPPCTDGHLAKAKELGASEEEVAEALAVAWAQGGGTRQGLLDGLRGTRDGSAPVGRRYSAGNTRKPPVKY